MTAAYMPKNCKANQFVTGPAAGVIDHIMAWAGRDPQYDVIPTPCLGYFLLDHIA